MNYTEIEEDPSLPDLSFLTRLLMIRDAQLPEVDPLPDDPAFEIFKEAKVRYIECVNKMSEALRHIEDKQSRLEKLVALVRRLKDAEPYKEQLESILDIFEKQEGLQFWKKSLQESTAEYMSLRKIFNLVEDPNKFMCFMCLATSIDHAFIPCGHTVCTHCLDRMRSATTCPFCRTSIRDRLKLFLG